MDQVRNTWSLNEPGSVQQAEDHLGTSQAPK